MGFAASSGRAALLIARKSDLEFKLQMINQQRMYWMNMSNRVAQAMTQQAMTMEPGSKKDLAFQEMMKRVQTIDKFLEMEGERVTRQHEAVQTELQSVRKVISKNIQSSFGLMARG